MNAEYKNWVPKGMVAGLGAGTAVLLAGALGLGAAGARHESRLETAAAAVCGAGALGLGAATGWSVMARQAFSYDGERQLSRQIVEGTAEYLTLPEGGVGLDVGCGSGALTIACAKRNPQARMVGVDRWGVEYRPYSKRLCERNAQAEGVSNISFRKGDATKLPFADESFDGVTSNYVYHNIPSRDRQAILLETLRVLKKGGVFAIHDIMTPARYGDMQAFVQTLRDMGYERVELIDTSRGMFMEPIEGIALLLRGSSLLVGKK